MLLTETIKNSTSAVKRHRTAIEDQQHAESYTKALTQLARSVESIKEALDCATVMKESGIVSTPIMDETMRDDLLTCINDCGNGVSDRKLTLDTVNLLKSKGDALSAQIKNSWRDAALQYSEGTKGYLSMIGGLANDPKQARELVESITKTVASEPSTKAVKSLVSDVSKAEKIIGGFSLNPEIENFLEKVSQQRASVLDLTPNILDWLKERELTSKLKIRF